MYKLILTKNNILKITLVVLGGVLILGILFSALQIFKGEGISFESRNLDLSSLKTEIDPETGWKIYRNEEYGYEIKYPESWHFKKDNESRVRIESCENDLYWSSGVSPRYPEEVSLNGYSITIMVHENRLDLTLDEYFRQKWGQDYYTEETKIGAVSVVSANEKEAVVSYYPYYFWTEEGYIYEVGCRDERSGLKSVADQILSTLRLIELIE